MDNLVLNILGLRTTISYKKVKSLQRRCHKIVTTSDSVTRKQLLAHMNIKYVFYITSNHFITFSLCLLSAEIITAKDVRGDSKQD